MLKPDTATDTPNKAAPTADSFATMATQLENLAKAQQFDAAADEPGISASEVARRETLRNHADLRFRLAGGI